MEHIDYSIVENTTERPKNDSKPVMHLHASALIIIDRSEDALMAPAIVNPLHVDACWHSHIQETKRYRAFEEGVNVQYKSARPDFMVRINHSIIENTKEIEDERLIGSKGLYEEALGMIFHNEGGDKRFPEFSISSCALLG